MTKEKKKPQEIENEPDDDEESGFEPIFEHRYKTALKIGDIEIFSASSNLGELKTTASNILKDKIISEYLHGNSYNKKKFFNAMTGVG